MKPSQLTQSEKIKVLRDRLGMTQIQFAKSMGICRATLCKFEAGQPPSGYIDLCADIEAQFKEAVAKLEPWEHATVLRRRMGITQGEMGRIYGKSRFWITQMEQGNEDCSSYLEFVKVYYLEKRYCVAKC